MDNCAATSLFHRLKVYSCVNITLLDFERLISLDKEIFSVYLLILLENKFIYDVFYKDNN